MHHRETAHRAVSTCTAFFSVPETPMPPTVIRPQLGESVVEGTVTKWLKQVGDRINEYDPILEINTDKVDTEIPSSASGVLLKILVPEGTTVNAGTVLGVIGEPGGDGGLPETPPAARARSG